MEFGTTEDERSLEAAARRFATERLRPAEREHERDRRFSDAVRRSASELGLAYDEFAEGTLPLGQWAQLWTALAAGDPTAPLALTDLGALTMPGFDPIQRRPGVVDVAGDVTVEGDVASGVVAWAPVDRVDWVLVVGPETVSLVTSGIDAAPVVDRCCGLQAVAGCQVTLNEAACEGVGGLAEARAAVTRLRLLAAASILGAARDAFEYAASYARERIAFDKPIAHHQGLAFQLADCATDVEAAALLLSQASVGLDHGAVSNAYALVVDTATFVVDRAVQTLGGHGYLYDHPVEKRMRDVRMLASLFGGRAAAVRDVVGLVRSFPEPLEISQ